MRDESEVLVSVVVTTDPYRDNFQPVLRPFLNQSLPPAQYELIFVDYERRPMFGPLVKDFRTTLEVPRMLWVPSPKPGRAAMNNLGVSLSKAPLLVFCGDDFLPGPSFVESHLAYHRAHPDARRVGIGAGIAPEEMRRQSPFLRWLEDSGELFGIDFRRFDGRLPEGFFYVANASLKREFFDTAGGFDERYPFPAHDDVEFGERLRQLGMVSEFVPNATCIHDHLVTLEARLEQLRQAGLSAGLRQDSAEISESPSPMRRRDLLRHWLRVLRLDGPRVTFWRFTLQRAYRRALREQLRQSSGLPL